jgi:hypothetical protein
VEAALALTDIQKHANGSREIVDVEEMITARFLMILLSVVILERNLTILNVMVTSTNGRKGNSW